MVYPSTLRRGYDDNLRIDWDNGRGGFSSIMLLDGKVPVAVVLGDYVPGEADPKLEAAANLFAASPALLEAVLTALPYVECAEDDPAYKPGAVRRVSARMRAALIAAGIRCAARSSEGEGAQ